MTYNSHLPLEESSTHVQSRHSYEHDVVTHNNDAAMDTATYHNMLQANQQLSSELDQLHSDIDKLEDSCAYGMVFAHYLMHEESASCLQIREYLGVDFQHHQFSVVRPADTSSAQRQYQYELLFNQEMSRAIDLLKERKDQLLNADMDQIMCIILGL